MNLTKIIPFFFILFNCMACAVSPTIGYTGEPSNVKDKIGAQTLNFEILLVTPDRNPLGGVKITAKTSQNEGFGITNDKGVTRIIVDRKESESILFTFSKANFESSTNVRSLPTNFKSAGLVFESPGPNRVTLSHFAIEGLYR